MQFFSGWRFPGGLLLLWVLAFAGANAQTVPSALVISATKKAEPCSDRKPASFPRIQIDCGHELEYMGEYSAEGTFKALSPHRRWYNQMGESDRFGDPGQPISRPVEVPPFVSMQPGERVVENYAGSARAVRPIHGQSQWAVLRDHLVTFAYGKEKPILSPQHMAVDSRDRVIISDPVAAAVHVLDGDSSFRILGGGRRHLERPAGVAVDAADNIYVVDSARGLVNVYDAKGKFTRYIGKIDDESFFDYPTGIAIHRGQGRIYLLDTARSLLLILDLRGNILKRVGHRSTDKVPVEFRKPAEVAVSNDSVAVLDAGGSRVQVFDLEGTLMRQFNTGASYGSGMSSVNPEMGLAVDADGNFYVSNFDDSVRVFNSEGRILNSFGATGDREGRFNNPAGLCVANTQLMVADTKNRRIVVLKLRSKATKSSQPVLIANAP